MATSAVQPKQTPMDKQRIIRCLPPGTSRLQVIDGDGKTRFKLPGDIEDEDQIVMKGNGEPVVMLGRPGRKSKTELPIDPAVADVLEAKQEHVESSLLISAAKNNPEGDDVLNHLIVAMAEEATSLEFERKEAERKGEDSSSYSAKRARVLKGLADTWLKRKERIEGAILDLDSPSFEVLMSFILETFRDAMKDSGMRGEMIETTFNKLAKKLEQGWKEEAKARMKGGK